MQTANATQTSGASPSTTTTKVVVATTVALTFISFWRAAAVVLNDMASTMYYIGGITEQAIGKPAPWMVVSMSTTAGATLGDLHTTSSRCAFCSVISAS